jgi:colanic acid biosynthesis glycosyl transferase WcaI
MRILVLTINYWPENTGIGAVVTQRCEYLASIGHTVTVCTAMPYYPQWRIQPDYAGKLFYREERNGVTILRSWLWVPHKVTSAKRVAFEASFLAGSFLRALRTEQPDLLLVISPPLGLGLSAVLLSRWLKVPYVFDVEDLQPDAAAELGMLPPKLLPFLYHLESMAYKHAAMVTTISDGMRHRIIAKGIPAEKVGVVPPAADNDLFSVGNTVNGRKFRQEHGLNGTFVVVHSGNMGVKQNLNVVLDTALRLKQRPEIVFLLTGDGAMKSELVSRAKDLRLDSVRFLPLQEKPEFLEMLAATDLALIVQRATVSDIAFPSKTITLLSAARPVAAAVSPNSEVARVILKSGGGEITEPENPLALAATIDALFHDSQTRLNLGESGRRYAFSFWQESRVLKNFESLLLKAAGAPASSIIENPAVISA